MNCSQSNSALKYNLDFFCSSLRTGSNKIVSCTDKLEGCGNFILQQVRKSFFEVIEGIVQHLKNTTEENLAHYLLTCLRWKFSAHDHQYLANSMVIDVLRNGNGLKDKSKNLLKYQWGHSLKFKSNDLSTTLAHSVIDTFECIATSALAKIVSSSKKDEKIVVESTDDVKNVLLKNSSSLMNTDATETLILRCFNTVFDQVNRYTELIKSFDPIDWTLFVKKRNTMRENGRNMEEHDISELEDEKTPDQLQEERDREQEEEKKRDAEREEASTNDNIPRDRVTELLVDQTEKEFKKIYQLYDKNFITKLLRMLDVFTSVALLHPSLKYYVIKTFTSISVASLLNLAMVCQHRHGVIIVNILKNLADCLFSTEIFNDAIDMLKKNNQIQQLMKMSTKTSFGDSKFLEFLFKLLISIRSKQWDQRDFTGSDAYDFSCGIMRLLHTLNKNSVHGEWGERIEKVLDQF